MISFKKLRVKWGEWMIQFQKDNCTVFQSCLYKTTSTVLDVGDAIILVDPNWLPDEIEEIATYVNSIIENKSLYLIYTHSDFDHIIASGAFTNATVIASQAFHSNPNKEDSMAAIRKFDEEYYITRNYKPVYPNVDIIIDEDGQMVRIGDVDVTFYLAPGHTNDSLFIVVESLGLFISGDYLSDIEFPFIYSSYEDYVATIEKSAKLIANSPLQIHIPGHGNVTEDLDELQQRVAQSVYYLNGLKANPAELLPFLKQSYPFFNSMLQTHQKNIELANEK